MKKVVFENENKEKIEGIVIGHRGSYFEVLTKDCILWVQKKSIKEMKEVVIVMDLK
jgi:hypothetical protein